MSKAIALVYPSSFFKDVATVKRRRGPLPATAALLVTLSGQSDTQRVVGDADPYITPPRRYQIYICYF